MLTHFVSNNVFTTFREENHGGIDYIIVNGVPLKEGVLNGRFVGVNEFGRFPQDWNGCPVVLRHPKQNGGSARVPAPDVPPVGWLYNTKLDGTRLVGEFWIDKGKLTSTPDGETVFTKIKNHHPIEVSTGYYAQSVPQIGKFNGLDYGLVDTDLHPDHVAILPDEVGACSLEDGCGLNRNQLRVNADGSLDQKVQRVRAEFYTQFAHPAKVMAENPTNLYVRDVYESYVICEEEADLYRVGYSVSEDGAVFDERDKWLPVKIEYTPRMNVTGLTGEAADMWEEIYQDAKEQYGDEERAAKVAWAAIKDKYKKDEKGDWVLKNVSFTRPLDGLDAQELEGLAALAVLANEEMIQHKEFTSDAERKAAFADMAESGTLRGGGKGGDGGGKQAEKKKNTIRCPHSGIEFEPSSARVKQHPKVAELKNERGHEYKDVMEALDEAREKGEYETIDEYIKNARVVLERKERERSERYTQEVKKEREERNAAKEAKRKREETNAFLREHGYRWQKDEYGSEESWAPGGYHAGIGEYAGYTWKLYSPEGKEVSVKDALDAIKRLMPTSKR